MDIVSSTLLYEYLKQGMLLDFDKDTIFGPDKRHYAVVANDNVKQDGAVIVVCVTSKYQRRLQIARHNDIDEKTVVNIPANGHPKFITGLSGFDCNYPVRLEINQLVIMFQQGKVRFVRNDRMINASIVASVLEGIKLSPLATPEVKKLL